MKKNILIASFDMEIGGVERSLINLLSSFDYINNKLDLMLYSHSGEFLNLLPNKHNLLGEIEEYATFRKPILKTLKEGKVNLGISRILAKIKANKIKKTNESGYIQMQYMWKYSMPFLPKLDKEYDVAISYLWPHYFIAEKVKAKKKIAWIHTDYSAIDTDVALDLQMWSKFDNIISISEECTKSFLEKYPTLKEKIVLIENITSTEFVKKMSIEKVENDIFDDNIFKLVTVGRLCYQKAIDNAIKALKILHDDGFKNIKWYVVGYGGDESMLKELIKENNLEDSFILLGKKINPYPYMKACDLYVQPSRYEGKAVTVTEAKILGKPIIITNYATAKSQVKHKEDGYICELSVEGIAKGIKTMYKNSELTNSIADNCKRTDYSNKEELEKLYELF